MQDTDIFSLTGKTVVVLGGGGVLGGVLAEGFARAGATIAVAGHSVERTNACTRRIRENDGEAKGYTTDVLDRDSLTACCDAIYDDLGQVDVLVNAIGGNAPKATTSPDLSFFDLPEQDLHDVMHLNFLASIVYPSQVFGARMKDNPNGGSIMNISSMSADRPLTRIPAYSAAKAAVTNFTKWLATHLAMEYSPKLRVNAIAPGFFVTEQNRRLLLEEDDTTLTARGKSIIEHTPAGRFGDPEDLVGAAIWLVSDASSFVTGTVIPIDGGFSGYTGV